MKYVRKYSTWVSNSTISIWCDFSKFSSVCFLWLSKSWTSFVCFWNEKNSTHHIVDARETSTSNATANKIFFWMHKWMSDTLAFALKTLWIRNCSVLTLKYALVHVHVNIAINFELRHKFINSCASSPRNSGRQWVNADCWSIVITGWQKIGDLHYTFRRKKRCRCSFPVPYCSISTMLWRNLNANVFHDILTVVPQCVYYYIFRTDRLNRIRKLLFDYNIKIVICVTIHCS